MTDKTDALIEQVEQMVGMSHEAWDTINPREIAVAFREALAAPAEGDGAVEMHVRHEGRGLLALYNGDKQIREIGITPGWHFKDRDEFIFRYNNYTRPAATAQVPEGFVLVPRAAALVAADVADEWAAMFADIPGLEKYDRFQHGSAVEQMRDNMRAALTTALNPEPQS